MKVYVGVEVLTPRKINLLTTMGRDYYLENDSKTQTM